MNNLQFGDESGIKAIYFHGVPGSPVEASIFNEAASQKGVHLISLDRSMNSRLMEEEEYLQELSNRVLTVSEGLPIRLIGFSIGASIALRVAALLGDLVESIYLVSPGAPLEKCNTEGMGAGRYTFVIAKRYPTLFSLFGHYQALLTRINPLILLLLLFSDARGKDAALLATPETRGWLENVQKSGFSSGIEVYDRDVKLYVGSWSHILPNVTASVSIWHGDSDNWAPIAMSEYLNATLSNVVHFSKCNGLSHYSCLIENTENIIGAISGKTT